MRCSALALLVLLPSAVLAQPAWKAVTTDDGVWVQEGDTKVLFYQRRLKSKDGKLARANYVHPLLDLDGEPLTEDFPADHLHHRGIFWAWHQVTIGGKAVGDPWALKDCGWDIRDLKAEAADGVMALHTEVYWLSPLWLNAKGEQMPFVRERVIIKVHRAEKERRVVDFEIGLTALQPETYIGGASPKPGYGGFSPRVRLPKDVRFLGPKGEVEPLAGPVDAAAWMDVAGTFANDRVSGVAMLIHPTTPGFPQPWILRRRGSMQNPVYPGATPVVLPTEKPLVLRYRLVIHRKAVDVDQLDRWHREYAQAAQAGRTIDLLDGERHGLQLDERNRLALEKTKAGYKARGEFLAKPIDLGNARSIRVDWTEQWTAPQTWKKHAGNPIFGPDKTGPWDKWTNGVSIIRMADNKTYRMYYAGRKSGGIGFAEASIRDPLTWKEHPASPVLKPLNNWEGGQINQPRVVKVTDTHWRMYYTGWGFKGPGTTWAMGLAESFDAGLSWKRHQDTPILDRGPADSPDGGGACVPMVLKVGDQWMMWYTAALATPGKQNIHQCLATSPDGIRWTKYDKNPVLTDDFSTGGKRIILSRCYVRHDDGVFRMWYSYAKPNYRICYAESLDGKTWEKSPIEPVLGPSPAKAWDDTMVEYPEVDIVDGVFRLWFCGNGFGSVGYAEGVKETSVRLSIRSRNDGEWSPWRVIERGAALKVDRFIQIRCELESTNSRLSPRLNQVVVRH